MNNKYIRVAQTIAEKVLRDKNNSKKSKVAAGRALSQRAKEIENV